MFKGFSDRANTLGFKPFTTIEEDVSRFTKQMQIQPIVGE